MNTAFVKIWGSLAGAVAWDEATGIAAFEYDLKFKSWNRDIAPLEMPVNSGRRSFSCPSLRKKADPALDTFKGLPGLLAAPLSP